MGPMDAIRCCRVLSVVFKTSEMHIPPWYWFSITTMDCQIWCQSLCIRLRASYRGALTAVRWQIQIVLDDRLARGTVVVILGQYEETRQCSVINNSARLFHFLDPMQYFIDRQRQAICQFVHQLGFIFCFQKDTSRFSLADCPPRLKVGRSAAGHQEYKRISPKHGIVVVTKSLFYLRIPQSLPVLFGIPILPPWVNLAPTEPKTSRSWIAEVINFVPSLPQTPDHFRVPLVSPG